MPTRCSIASAADRGERRSSICRSSSARLSARCPSTVAALVDGGVGIPAVGGWRASGPRVGGCPTLIPRRGSRGRGPPARRRRSPAGGCEGGRQRSPCPILDSPLHPTVDLMPVPVDDDRHHPDDIVHVVDHAVIANANAHISWTAPNV